MHNDERDTRSKWSWRIGTFSGIGVYVHATFLLLIGFVGFQHYAASQSMVAAMSGIVFVLALFLCVVLHEFGHALMARKFSIGTRDITLLPIGGVARLERMPDKPIQELWVALAGPAVNVAIALLLGAWLLMSSTFVPLSELTLTGGPFLERLMVVNVFLVLFNMLPAFPMDGGRVVRALLALRLEYVRATRYAARLGQGMAIGFAILGFFTNPFLMLIAFFVFVGAGQEAGSVQLKSSLNGIPTSQATITDYRTLHPDEDLNRAVHLILTGSQQDFPVVHDGRVAGLLTRRDLFRALEEERRYTPVSRIMRRVEPVDSSTPLHRVFETMRSGGHDSLPVVRDDRLMGLVTMENVGEFLAVHSASKNQREVEAVAA